MQDFDDMAEHGHATGTPVVTRIAVLEGIDAPQLESPFVVPRQAHTVANHGFVEKLQAFFSAGPLCGKYADFSRLERIQP